MQEVAERAGAALGRTLSYCRETVEEAYASRAHFGQEPWQLDAWVSSYTAIAEGETERVTDHVQRITGLPARTIEAALTGHAESVPSLPSAPPRSPAPHAGSPRR